MEPLELRDKMPHFLSDEKIYLKKLSEDDDYQNYLQFINDKKNLIWTDVGIYPFCKEDIVKFIKETTGLFLSIFNDQKEHVGNIHLSRINLVSRNAELGIVLAKEHHGKGYGERAIKLVIKHAFEILNLHRIHLTVVSANKAAIKLYERLGFTKEGIERDLHLYNFQYFDGTRYSILESEYKKLRDSKTVS